MADEAHEANEDVEVDKAKADETEVTNKASVAYEAKTKEAIAVDEANVADTTN